MLLNQLQSIQNRECRVILGLKAKEPTLIHMKNLHWLKIKERIEFKILLLAYESLTGKSPSYLTNLINYNCISGSRKSSLCPRPVRTSAGARAFQHCAPVLWNKLPINTKCCSDIYYYYYYYYNVKIRIQIQFKFFLLKTLKLLSKH